MLASPHASTSQATYSLSPIRAASHSSASSTRSSTTSLSSRDAADAHPLAESLLREEDEGEQGSPATSEGGAGSSTHLVSSPNGTTAMDVCEEEGEEEGGQHIKLSRRMSSESAGSAGRPAHRHPNDPSRPPNRKAQRLDTTAEADITACPPAELLSLLASVLSHIARANDARRGSMQPPAMCCSGWSRGMDEAAETKKRSVDTMTLAARTAHSSSLSTLCFHARNVPSIAIEAYLLRILKCESSLPS